MLFDLRGRGRRRTVKVVYSMLAILLGGGLVLFGIGSDTQGGLFDAFNEDDGTDSSVTEPIQRDIDRAEAAVIAMPRDAPRWASLAELRFKLANVTGYDDTTGGYTDEGKAVLLRADQAWQRYLSLEPEQLNSDVARRMVQAYDRGGLAQFDKAVRAQEIVIDQSEELSEQQRANLFANLAVLAYSAEQARKGDIAADRAVELTPETQRKLLRDQLDQVKTAVAAEAQQGAPGAAPGGATGGDQSVPVPPPPEPEPAP